MDKHPLPHGAKAPLTVSPFILRTSNVVPIF